MQLDLVCVVCLLACEHNVACKHNVASQLKLFIKTVIDPSVCCHAGNMGARECFVDVSGILCGTEVLPVSVSGILSGTEVLPVSVSGILCGTEVLPVSVVWM